MSGTSRKDPEAERPARGAQIGFLVTNLIKLGGLVIAVNEGLLRTEVRPVVIGVAAFMMAGAQYSETFFDRLFGR